MSTVKIFCTAAIMIACFAVIYPRFMHPLVLRAFGLNDPPKRNSHGGGEAYPPGYKGKVPSQGRRDDAMAEEMRRNMRHGPHPGMRHAAEMNSRQQGSQGSSKGMMGVVLPMYAVGIVLYLIYTLYKVFNKSKGQGQPGWAQQSQQQQRGMKSQAQAPATRDSMGFPVDFDNSGNPGNTVQDFLHDEGQRKDLEDLLTRADDKNVSVEEMRLLQKRLEETEAQMTKILAAMQGVKAGVTDVAQEKSSPAKPQTKTAVPLDDENDSKDQDKSKEEKDVKNEDLNKGETSKENAAEKEDSVDLDRVDTEDEQGESEGEACMKEGKEEEVEEKEEEIGEKEEKSEMIPEKSEEESAVRQRTVTRAED